jgi:prolyl 4-hydroxylase
MTKWIHMGPYVMNDAYDERRREYEARIAAAKELAGSGEL